MTQAKLTDARTGPRTVTVRFYATFRAVVGEKHAEVEVPRHAVLQDVLDAVLERFPDLAPHLLDDRGRLSRQTHLFVNGRGAVHLPDGMCTRLDTNDQIDFFPAVAGG